MISVVGVMYVRGHVTTARVTPHVAAN